MKTKLVDTAKISTDSSLRRRGVDVVDGDADEPTVSRRRVVRRDKN